MIAAFRLVKSRYAARAFDGVGAKTFGGRWNHPGVPMVYLSDTPSLAALELLVHLHQSQILDSYVQITLRLPEKSIELFDAARLPPDWRTDPAPHSTAQIGDDWIASRRRLVLSVPSVLIPSQRNFLLNPLHKDFERTVKSALHEPFRIDPRLGRG